MKKTLIAALAVLLSLPLLFSCADKTGPEAATTPAAATSADTPADTTTVPEESETLPLLDVKTYDNATFTVIWPEPHQDGHFMHNEIFSEGSDGDTINSAVFTRNVAVEEKYKVSIKSELVWCSKIADAVTRDIASGDTAAYDAACAPIAMMTSAALEGKWLDYNTLPYYSADMPWWEEKIMSGYSMAEKKFFGGGDMIFSDNFYPYTVFVNLGMYNDYHFEKTPFELVKSGEWTLDKMTELCAAAPLSSDDVWDYNDRYGILVNTSLARAEYFGAGYSITKNDASGFPEISMTVEGAQEVLEKMVKLFHEGHVAYDTDDDIGHNIPGLTHAQTALKMYTAGQALFYSEELIIAERLTNAGSEINTGLLPLPKFKADQERYLCPMNDSVVICIPANADPERSSLILSAMGRESIDTLTPAFYSVVLTYRYVNNAESVETLDIILDGAITQDIGAILKWGGLMKSFMACVTDGSTDFSSKYTSGVRSAAADMRTFSRKLENLTK